MKRFQRLTVGLLATAGVMLVALPVSGASAAKLLTLTQNEGTEVVPAPGPASVGFAIEGCVLFTNGTLTSNGASKDILTASSNLAEECSEPGFSMTGTVLNAQLPGSGKATLKTTIELTTPGPCLYKFKTAKGVFEVPGEVFIVGTAVGKLNKKPSNPSCEKTLSTSFVADATNEPFGERFGDHL
jgi:hypothetical protein